MLKMRGVLVYVQCFEFSLLELILSIVKKNEAEKETSTKESLVLFKDIILCRATHFNLSQLSKE